MRRVALLLLALALGLRAASARVQTVLQLGYGVAGASAASQRIQALVRAVDPAAVLGGSDAACRSAVLCLSFGNTTLATSIVGASTLAPLGSEGFAVRAVAGSNGTTFVVANGNPYVPPASASRVVPSWIASTGTYGGALFGAYAALESLGFAFLHPLAPIIPAAFDVAGALATANRTEAPALHFRAWHYHSEHPLELTDVLQGFDASTTLNFSLAAASASAASAASTSSSSSSPSSYFESWASMVPQVGLFYEWLVANRQNRVEWVLLWDPAWGVFANSSVRQGRLATLTSLAHGWGLQAGADVPIAEIQQHAWYMTDAQGTLAEQNAQIAAHVDWFAGAGFDYLSTESGFSEFTHPNDTSMLAWMNFTAIYALANHSLPVYIKCHCSTGQYCDDYPDPRTGQPLNFNFLPHYADTRMGIMPHTVQVYAWNDPAPTYGNENFTYMFDFLLWQAELNAARNPTDRRLIVFHGETAYWVNYDIDVPLFLGTLYGERRLADLCFLQQQAAARGVVLDGQNNFHSGSEWAYWLGDVLTARAAWGVPAGCDPNNTAAALAVALDPIVQPIFAGSVQAQAQATEVLQTIVADQRRLLVFGQTGAAPTGPPWVANDSLVAFRNGLAYLAGWDTFADLAVLVGITGTQPSRVPFPSVSNTTGAANEPSYAELMPLLNEVATVAATHLAQWVALAPSVAPGVAGAADLFADVQDTLNITALRAAEVAALYDAAFAGNALSLRQARLATARDLVVTATDVVQRREARYRVPVPRIASWRESPTSYHYGYIWTVHSLLYFWRDWSIVNTLVNITAASQASNPGLVFRVDESGEKAAAAALATQRAVHTVRQVWASFERPLERPTSRDSAATSTMSKTSTTSKTSMTSAVGLAAMAETRIAPASTEALAAALASLSPQDLWRLSPCYLNIINPADVALNEGLVQDIAAAVRALGDALGNYDVRALTDCLAASPTEQVFPQDL